MKYKISFLLMFVVAVAGFGNTVSAAAEGGEAYLALAHAYYKHPVTGIIEDPGNNEGIGQSMADKMLNDDALMEKTSDGKIYITLRLYLTEYISEVYFWTQERSSDNWTEASHSIMQENLGGEYCTDYRLQLPAEDAVVKCSFFVEPMGRAIIFFMDFSDSKAGSGDFVVSTESSGQAAAIEDSTESNTASSDSAEMLIASAKGLVVSDDTLLAKGEKINNAYEDSEGITEGQVQSEGEVQTGANSNIMPALSWKLVWQCILIITLPGLLVGSGLYLLMILTGRRKGGQK